LGSGRGSGRGSALRKERTPRSFEGADDEFETETESETDVLRDDREEFTRGKRKRRFSPPSPSSPSGMVRIKAAASLPRTSSQESISPIEDPTPHMILTPEERERALVELTRERSKIKTSKPKARKKETDPLHLPTPGVKKKDD
jgi:hypothetical protein